MRSSPLGADMVCKSRNSFADALFTQGLMALMQPSICCVRAQSAREFVTEFSGGATPHRSGAAGCDEALAVGKPHLVSPHVPCLLDAPRDVALMGVVVGCPVEKKMAPAYCGECRSLRQGCMPRTRDSEQAGCPLIAATGSGRRDVFIRSNRSAR